MRKVVFFPHPRPTVLLRQLTEGFQLTLRKPENSLLAPKLVFPPK